MYTRHTAVFSSCEDVAKDYRERGSDTQGVHHIGYLAHGNSEWKKRTTESWKISMTYGRKERGHYIIIIVIRSKYKGPISMAYMKRGSHARMGTARVEQEVGTDTNNAIVREMEENTWDEGEKSQTTETKPKLTSAKDPTIELPESPYHRLD